MDNFTALKLYCGSSKTFLERKFSGTDEPPFAAPKLRKLYQQLSRYFVLDHELADQKYGVSEVWFHTFGAHRNRLVEVDRWSDCYCSIFQIIQHGSETIRLNVKVVCRSFCLRGDAHRIFVSADFSVITDDVQVSALRTCREVHRSEAEVYFQLT